MAWTLLDRSHDQEQEHAIDGLRTRTEGCRHGTRNSTPIVVPEVAPNQTAALFPISTGANVGLFGGNRPYPVPWLQRAHIKWVRGTVST